VRWLIREEVEGGRMMWWRGGEKGWEDGWCLLSDYIAVLSGMLNVCLLETLQVICVVRFIRETLFTNQAMDVPVNFKDQSDMRISGHTLVGNLSKVFFFLEPTPRFKVYQSAEMRNEIERSSRVGCMRCT
jgi:hypothetical protein